jgi:YD repeat-containing protein
VYNGDGTLWYRTDAKGQKVEYTYDSDFMRLTSIKQYPAGSGTPDPCQGVTFGYDVQTAVGLSGQTYVASRLTGAYSGANSCAGGLSEREDPLQFRPDTWFTPYETGVAGG